MASSTALTSLPSADNRHEHASGVDAGPLSSTLIDVNDHSVTDVGAVDTVAMKLFTHVHPDGQQSLSTF